MTIWVVLSAKKVSDKLTDMIDKGDLASATRLAHAIDSFIDKLKSFCQTSGGSMPISLYERCILSIPDSIADQIPVLVQEYSDELHEQLSVGIGLNIYEASSAAKLSARTHNIELYDPAHTFEDITKSDQVVGSPNLFEQVPNIKPDEDIKGKPLVKPKKAKPVPVMSPDAQTSAQLSSQMIQSTMQELGFNPQPPQQQMQQQQQPRDLLETLHGQQVPGYNPPEPEEGEEEGHPAGAQEAEASDVDTEEKAMNQRIAEAEKEAEVTNKKLAQLLAQVREQVPALMQLHDKNPEAFKHSINVINKLVALASKRHKVTKSEPTEDEYDALEKMIARHGVGYKAPPGGGQHHIYPVGTRHGRKRKVLVNGKAVWRSMASGMIKDPQGGAVSVRSSNASADPKSNKQ